MHSLARFEDLLSFEVVGYYDVKYSKNTGSLFNYEYSVNLYNGESEGTSLISHESNDKGTYEFNVNTQLTSEYNAMLCKYSYRALGNDVTINEFDISYR